MANLAEYERYMSRLCEKLGHADRRAGFMEYGRGLMLPIERKSVEPLAAHTDPWHVSAKHQSLHHMVAKSDWRPASTRFRQRVASPRIVTRLPHAVCYRISSVSNLKSISSWPPVRRRSRRAVSPAPKAGEKCLSHARVAAL